MGGLWGGGGGWGGVRVTPSLYKEHNSMSRPVLDLGSRFSSTVMTHKITLLVDSISNRLFQEHKISLCYRYVRGVVLLVRDFNEMDDPCGV